MDEQTLLQLELYFDGALSPDEQRDFEARLARDRALQHTVQQQRAIESALRRLMPAPEVPPVQMPTSDESADVIGAIPHSTGSSWLRRLAIAAVVCAGLFGVWSTWQHLKPIDDQIAQISPEKYYRDSVANGMQVYYVCDPGSQQFADYFRNLLGQPLQMSADEPGFKCLGVNKCNVLSPSTLAVLVRMNQTPVIVLIDRKQCGNSATVPPQSGLYVYQRDLGPLEMFEISPVDHPQVLDKFVTPGTQG